MKWISPTIREERDLPIHRRKGRLLRNTSKGADASVIVYTVVETAKANGLEPYRYLKLLLTELPYLAKRI